MSGTTQQTTYVERAITITIQLGEGQFGETGSNTVTLEDLRCVATMNKIAPPGFGQAEFRIYGMTQTVMNKASNLGVPNRMVRLGNIVTVQAGQKGQPLPVIWKGFILDAWQNLEGTPDTFFQIISVQGALEAITPGAPLSYSGPFDVASAMAGLATIMARKFINYGVTAQLSGGYFPGTAMQQAIAIARAANIELDPGGAPGAELVIWPKNKTRIGVVPLISVDTGLVGYPRYQSGGMGFRCLFNPNIIVGGVIQMQSTLFPNSTSSDSSAEAILRAGGPNGFWYVVSPSTINLSSQVPNGPWFNDVTCSRVIMP